MKKESGAAIGTFDGVHLGHRAVLATLQGKCKEMGLCPIALTFDRHPLALIDPVRTPPEITSLPKKKKLISQCGVEPVVLEFNEDLRQTNAAEWMKKIKEELGVRLLVIGYDNTFGSDGVNMSVADYKRLGKEIGIEVIDVAEIKDISSSAIRKAIKSGDLDRAEKMLGRKFSFSGTVVNGNRIGRTLGFPTANLAVGDSVAVPARGTYAAVATLPDGKEYKSMVNIGTRPTLRRGDDQVIEAHLLDYQGDLYGKKISLRFLKRLRDEIKFDTIDALRRQIALDREMVEKTDQG